MSIDLEVRDRVGLITINRPERMNALDGEHYRELSQAWRRVRDDDAIRVALVTGAGDRAFCSGADLKDMITHPSSAAEMWHTQKDQLLNRGIELWKPVVAAVNGWCLGGGMTLLLATDIRFAVPEARFGLSEVKRGIIPANGGTQRVLSQLPYAVGMELLLTGEDFSAQQALSWGLINRVVPPETLLEEALALAERLSENAPLAVQAIKELAIRSRDLDLASGLRMEQIFSRFLLGTEDAREGARAFSEKRKSRFLGR